jgi:hypothetical protein
MQRLFAAFLLALAAVGAQADAQGPVPGMRMSGEGTLRFLGMEIYQARLWVTPQFRSADYAAHPLALELNYRRGFTAKAIAERSLQEMRRIGTFTEAQSQSWLQALQAALPDVKAGDRVTGLYRPGVGAVFRLQERTVGEVADPEFARLFFGIWLSPQTSEPALRQSLLPAAAPNPSRP